LGEVLAKRAVRVDNLDLIVRNLAEKNGVSFEQQSKILKNKLKKRRD
jgi:hypothetical protein